MKTLSDLKNVITDPRFLQKQFEIYKDKNILYVNPQLSGKDLYRVFLPYFALSETTGSAIHHISSYNPLQRLMGGKETQIDDYMIDWAHYIVFPFTTQPLVLALYKRIRQRNPHCKIIYLIDFNFYELRPAHPFYNIFKDETTIKYVEDNMFYADFVVVSNKNMQPYLLKKWSETIIPQKYIGQKCNMLVSYQPFFTDIGFVTANVDFTPEKLSLHKPVPEPPLEVKQRIAQTQSAAKKVKQKKVNKKNKAAKKHELKKNEKNKLSKIQVKKTHKHAASTKQRNAGSKPAKRK